MSGKITHGKGYGIKDTKKYTDFSVGTFPLKPDGPDEVTLKIECCGVCGSDVHTVTGGWGPMSVDWCVPGHEIIGQVTHVGDNVKEFKVGQRVGVGAQTMSCLKCDRCKSDNEQYCPHGVDTYNSKYYDGTIAQGGYSTAIRTHQQFVFAIPDAFTSEEAAPMLCAGLTVFSPLIRNGTGPGKTVGIVGIGGLGHMAIQFAKALGAKCVVFSHSPNKKEDCMKLGADEFIVTGDDDKFSEQWFDKIDYILSCADAAKLPLSALLKTLKVGGKFTSVGLPDEPWSLKPQVMQSNSTCIGSSHIGSKVEANYMFKLAAEKGVRPIIDKVFPMSQAGEAIEGTKNNKVRYRYVVKNDLE